MTLYSDAYRLTTFNDDFFRLSISDYIKVFSRSNRPEICSCRRASSPFFHRQLKVPNPFLFATVIIVITFISGINCCIQPFINNWTCQSRFLYGKRAVATSLIINMVSTPSLRTLEQRPHVLPTPAVTT